jgi:hypothetical protein
MLDRWTEYEFLKTLEILSAFNPSCANGNTSERAFLRFTVETTLAGQGETLKEYLIGTEVYDRKPPYHPSADSIVRSEARRLRNKLKEYYESVGRDDPVLIYYRLGSYVPVLRAHSRRDENDNVKDAVRSEHFIDGRGIRTAVLPFVDASGGEDSGSGRSTLSNRR